MSQSVYGKQGWSNAADREAILHLTQAVSGSRPWHLALLESVGLWASPEETVGGRRYRYLIDGEAFDWLLLAERLCAEIRGMVPDEELDDLVFHGLLPVEVGDEEFKAVIGPAKYHAYLNFLYGIIAERFLLAAVEDDIRKEARSQVVRGKGDDVLDGHVRLYGENQERLLERFREERGHRHREMVNLDELQEFTYWLFKYRLNCSDKARVASDTRKAMDYLSMQMAEGRSRKRVKSGLVIEHP